jgi:hypothetical protein
MSDQPQRPADPYGATEQEPRPPEADASGLATQPPPHGRVVSTAAVVALVGSLAGWGWFASENAREGWWTHGQHVAVEPDDEGWATIDTVGVRLTGSELASVIDGVGPPTGFEYLVLDFEVTAQETEQFRSCTVEVLDTQGRSFLAGREVPNGDPYTSDLMCGTSDPADDPVPGDQSTLVLVPVGAELVSVRIDSREFPSATFVEIPLPR